MKKERLYIQLPNPDEKTVDYFIKSKELLTTVLNGNSPGFFTLNDGTVGISEPYKFIEFVKNKIPRELTQYYFDIVTRNSKLVGRLYLIRKDLKNIIIRTVIEYDDSGRVQQEEYELKQASEEFIKSLFWR